MAGGLVSVSQMQDLLLNTLPNLPFDKRPSVALRDRSFPGVDLILRNDLIRLEGGTSWQRDISLRSTSQAKMTTMYGTDQIAQEDARFRMTADFCYAQTYHMYDRREMNKNRGRSRLYGHIAGKRQDAMISFAELLEDQVWGVPQNDSDFLNIRGVFYHIRPASANVSSAGDFIGINWRPADGSAVSSLYQNQDRANFGRLRNYAFTYNNIDGTFITNLRLGLMKTNFQPPSIVSDLGPQGSARGKRIYSGANAANAYADLCSKRGDTMSMDLEPFAGQLAFRKIPWKDVPSLDADASQPVMWWDAVQLYPISERGNYMQESEPVRHPFSHNVVAVYIDTSLQMVCENPRSAGGIGHRVRTT